MYIDPNTGGILFQTLAVLFGLLSGVILFSAGRIRMAFARLVRYLRDFSHRGNEEGQPLKSDSGSGE